MSRMLGSSQAVQAWRTSGGLSQENLAGNKPGKLLSPALAIAKKPRFGWGWAGHGAIENASSVLLSPSSYRNFILHNLPAIHEASTLQDRYRTGADHFVSLEKVTAPKSAPNNSSKVTNQDFKQFESRFTPTRQAQMREAFAQQPLTETSISRHPNVFTACIRDYQKLVALLRQVKAKPPRAPGERTVLAKELALNVGSLAHYVGDLNQPLHTTQHYNWSLAHGAKNNAHSQLERHLMQANDYTQWWNKLKASIQKQAGSVPESLSLPEVKARLLRDMEASYLGVFPLVDADREARIGTPDKSAYFSKLHSQWQPTVEEHLDAASLTLSKLLQSAYVEAGEPEIPDNIKVKLSPGKPNPFESLMLTQSASTSNLCSPDAGGIGKRPRSISF